MGAGPKVPYPKHVWSPAGGWYAQPKNWKANTVVAGLVMFGIVVVTWRFSGEREMRARKPEPGGFYPSRWYSKQLQAWDEEDRLKAAQEKKN